ncbi:Progonadoliberin-1, partial [Acanthisitta chloris]
MEKSRKIFTGVFLFVLSVGICLAQHWSYGLQPGGKRNAKDLVESFQEIAQEMARAEEVQQPDWPGSSQHSRIRDLQEAVVS